MAQLTFLSVAIYKFHSTHILFIHLPTPTHWHTCMHTHANKHTHVRTVRGLLKPWIGKMCRIVCGLDRLHKHLKKMGKNSIQSYSSHSVEADCSQNRSCPRSKQNGDVPHALWQINTNIFKQNHIPALHSTDALSPAHTWSVSTPIVFPSVETALTMSGACGIKSCISWVCTAYTQVARKNQPWGNYLRKIINTMD